MQPESGIASANYWWPSEMPSPKGESLILTVNKIVLVKLLVDEKDSHSTVLKEYALHVTSEQQCFSSAECEW